MDATQSAPKPRRLTPEEVARFVKTYREELGLKQINLAQEAGVDERTIQRIESGSSPASAETLRRIAKAFKLDDPDFFTMPHTIPTADELQRQVEEWKKHNVLVDVSRASKGIDLVPLLNGCAFFSFAHPNPDGDEHVEAFARLLDGIRDYSMIWDELSPGERIKAAQYFSEPLVELEQLGFRMFTGVRRAQFALKDGKPEPLEASIGYVFIRPKGENVEKVAVSRGLQMR